MPLIQVTSDVKYLLLVGGDDYAESHVGKHYEAEFDDTSWAVIDGYKFPPKAYRLAPKERRIVMLHKGERHEHRVVVDTRTRVADVRRECPNFFSVKGECESVRAYRGFLIVQNTFRFSTGGTKRQTVLYAYDVEREDTFHVDLPDHADTAAARETVRDLLTVQV